MGNEESTLGDENEDDVEITLKVKPKQSKVASDAPGEIPVFVFPPGEKLPPRQGGFCRNSWTCCKCKHMNKTGKWRSCQNPSQTPLKVAYPGAQQTQCRHERCIDCMPKGFALHPGAEHIAVRRWPPDGLTEDDKTVQNDICAQMAMALMIRDVGLECKAKKDEGKTKRDPLSGLRIGEWPGGF